MILKCTCRHAVQDERYGSANRVHNAMAKQAKSPQQYRCSVCCATRTRDKDNH